MPIIQVSMLEGRSMEQKACLMKKITEAVIEAIDAPPDAIKVLINEIPHAHWASGGVVKTKRN